MVDRSYGYSGKLFSVTKPARPVETVHEDEELKDDFDIEIG